MRHRGLAVLLAAAALLVTGITYWPVTHADFVWDDWPSFHDKPWLTEGDLWLHYLFRDFNSWTMYFRPLGVAFFTAQVRLFHSAPGPMHAVSLLLHLLDTLLVGLLAWQCSRHLASARERTWLMAGAMWLYGLHPILIEPVAWIGCQFDLLATLLMLAGLLANARIAKRSSRAAALSLIFFLAACVKESAVSLPLLVVIFDWALFSERREQGLVAATRTVLVRNWPAYAGMLLAGIGYLAFRRLAMGPVENPFGSNGVSLVARLQEISLTYVSYWKMLLWPMPGMSPIHPVDTRQFAFAHPVLLLADGMALGLVLVGLWLMLRRASPLACIIMAATVALLPVLHVASVDFERSLYHERYAMLALAVICAMLPLLWRPLPQKSKSLARLAVPVMSIALFFWSAFALIDIHLILPNWANDTSLWRWALDKQPHASQAKDNLLHTYIRDGNLAEARKLGDRFLADPVPCANCMLNVAKLALDDKDSARAGVALEQVRRSPLLTMDKSMLHTYYQYTGRMLVLQGQWDDARQVLQAALSLDSSDTQSRDLLSQATSMKSQAAPGKVEPAKPL